MMDGIGRLSHGSSEAQDTFESTQLISMQEGVRILLNSKGTFPGMSKVIHEAVPAAFTDNQGDFFIDLFLQLFRIDISSRL
ncbi:MAG: hypothetical protein ACXVAB_07610, partial [Thermodesulfobacteriota bacterium]